MNEWGATAVGFPLWLNHDGPDAQSATVVEQGIEVRISARRTHTEFTMGDGGRVRCGAMSRFRVGVDPAGSRSPTCGYTYQDVSPRSGPFQVRATSHWSVTWQALGQQGSLSMQRDGAAVPITVVELVSVRVR